MKIKQIILIISGIFTFILLLFSLIVLALILKLNWWWFFGTLIGSAVIWLTIGFIMLIKKLNAPLPERIKIDIKDAKEKEVNAIKLDSDNPDNFMIEKSRLERHGREGAEKTPILILEGYGTEKMQKRVSIINLNNPDKEVTRLIAPKPEEVQRAIRLIAENPTDEPTVEDIQTGFGFGMPSQHIRRVIPSSQQARDKLDKQEAEEKGAT